MKQRPALAGAFVIALGIVTARFSSAGWEVFAAAAAIALVFSLFAVYRSRKDKGRDRSCAAPFLAFLLFSSAAAYTVNERLQHGHHLSHYLNSSDSLKITCTVVDAPVLKEGKLKLLVSHFSISNGMDTVVVEGKAYLSIFPDKRKKEIPKEILYGSVISFTGVIQAPGEERNPGEFSYREYLALNNIFATFSVFGYSRVDIAEHREPSFFFEQIIFPSKEFVVRTIRTVMKGDEANFLIGLLLGDRTDISEEIKLAFMNTGTIHVLAVSGSHVVLVAEIIIVVVGLLRFPRKAQIVLAMLVLVYYMFLTGATPSVVRATIMMIVLYAGKLFEERTDVYNVLGVSAVIILLIEPKQLFDVGFQLSFSAVFSIVYFYPKLIALIPKIPERLEEFKLITWVWQLFAVSLAAQVGTLPFTAYYFEKVSIVSLFANLIVVPLVGVIVTIGLSGALLGIASMWIASCFNEVNNIIAVITLNFVKWAEQIPYAVLHTAGFGLKETLIYSAVIGLLFNIGKREIQKRIILASLFGANIFLFISFSNPSERNLRVMFLDVGQGDGAVIQFPTGETVVVDAGPSSPGYDAGERTVVPFLRRLGVSTIDAVITSHPHADHLGGVPYLLKHFPVRQTVDAGQQAQSRLFSEYKQLQKTTEHIIARAGMMLTFGDGRFFIVHPTERFMDSDSSNGYSDLNGTSVVFKLQYGTTTFLFTGDAETEAEEHIVGTYGDFLDSDVLKSGHHGSSTSSSEQFISYVTPEQVIVSVGKFNKFRHPSKRVLERFASSGSKIYRTDIEGAVIFESDGNSIRKIVWR
ncbi:MAG: DNA internalization-related competence protein ComEC/Rec2 [Bacteroidota bacterium]